MRNNTCPYNVQPKTAWWRHSVAKVPAGVIDPTSDVSIKIDRETVLASAGSCFAQHVRNHIARRGYTYLITEHAPEGQQTSGSGVAADSSYGAFPARFGNIYTTMQLRQLFDRAYGRFVPEEDHWVDRRRFFDPFRAHIEPGGFASLEHLRIDRARHFAAVREMFERVEVFIFTLGLTEAWRSKIDGAVFQVSPGCSIGEFDPDRHEFVNFGVTETTNALSSFISDLKSVNPNVHVVLTVSPVPLLATMTAHHVVQATTHSKAVLRVAAEQARASFDCVDYFPSYEIITATGRAHEFFAGDLRTVTLKGVTRVMDLFFQRYAGEVAPVPRAAEAAATEVVEDVPCDEEVALRAMDAS